MFFKASIEKEKAKAKAEGRDYDAEQLAIKAALEQKAEREQRGVAAMHKAINESAEAQRLIADGGKPWVCPTKARVYYTDDQIMENAGLVAKKRADWGNNKVLEYADKDGNHVSKNKAFGKMATQRSYFSVVD